MQLTATTPAVTIDLDARRQELATAGDAVQIELPSGRTVRGTITSVGKVAVTETTAQGDAGSPTISVVIDTCRCSAVVPTAPSHQVRRPAIISQV